MPENEKPPAMRVDIYCAKKIEAKRTLLRRGAGGRTRTGTVSPPVDFESTTSANSITPAQNIRLNRKNIHIIS